MARYSLPRPLIIKLFDAINEYNNSKQREDQRPRWGLHMTEAHVMAIASGSSRFDPGNGSHSESEGKGQTSAKTTTKTKRYSKLNIYVLHFVGTSS